MSKCSMSLLPQKKAVKTDLEPFKQETKPLAKIWCEIMEDNAHQPDELNSHLRVMKTYLKANYKFSDLLRAQRNDRMTSSLKSWNENGALIHIIFSDTNIEVYLHKEHYLSIG